MLHARRRLLRNAGSVAIGLAVSSIVEACGSPGPAPEVSGTVTRNRVPPGQQVTTRFPILDLGIRPDVPLDQWTLELKGDIENPVTLSWPQFQNLPHVERIWDFHCVTGWTKLDVHWAGVLFSEIVSLAKPRATVQHVIFESRDRYTTNARFDELMVQEAMLVDQLEGQALPLEHGGPMRGMVPWLYAWKSAKFVGAIRFQEADEPGYWETRGYNNHADPWREERFG